MTIVLTAKDFSILEQMLHSGTGSEQTNGLVRRKLDDARIVFGSDIDPEIVTLDSRVRYRINGNAPEERTLIVDSNQEVRGMTIQLGTLRGVAMLGMAAGEAVTVPRRDGTVKRWWWKRCSTSPRRRAIPIRSPRSSPMPCRPSRGRAR